MSTVDVPVVPDQTIADYVSQVFTFDVYGICRNKAGKVQPDSEQRVGGGRSPYGSGNYVLRIPPSEQTTFVFTDAVGLLLQPPPTGQLAPVACPTGQTPGLHRINIDDYEVYATSFGSRHIPVDIDYYLPETREVRQAQVTLARLCPRGDSRAAGTTLLHPRVEPIDGAWPCTTSRRTSRRRQLPEGHSSSSACRRPTSLNAEVRVRSRTTAGSRRS